MSNDVFANGREISCKAADGKSISAFPDVCLSPPSPPAGPVPLPYPNTGLASDTSGGSKNVKISGKEVMLRDSSSFKKSTGDEAATKSLGMGVVTHQIRGKVYFTSWSMNVKIEEENAVRHLDIMTHNHASKPGNSPPWPYKDATAQSGPCKGQPSECKMTPYRPNKCKKGKTGHHAIPVHCFMAPGARALKKAARAKKLYQGCEKYDPGKAVVVCVSGAGKVKKHGDIHEGFDALEDAPANKGVWTYKQAEDAAVKTIAEETGCNDACIRAQIRHNHRKELGIKNSTKLRADSTGKRAMPKRPSLTRQTGPTQR
jgi:hypothetical protein